MHRSSVPPLCAQRSTKYKNSTRATASILAAYYHPHTQVLIKPNLCLACCNFATVAKISINVKTGNLAKAEPIVGIDLGTTHSLIAYVNPQTKNPEILKVDGQSLVPSIVHFTQNGGHVVGNKAKNALLYSPQRTIFSVKRLLGKNLADIQQHNQDYSYQIVQSADDDLVKVAIDNTYYSPIELSAMVLAELKHTAEQSLGTSISKAVITVPAYFNDAQRQATRDAGKLAGLDVLRILNEPTAASLAYGLQSNMQNLETIMVYDFGGGTFDVSILAIQNGVFEVIATKGNTYLGGDDISFAIMNFWIQQLAIPALSETEKQNLRFAAENAKIELSSQSNFEYNIQIQNVEFHLKLDNNQYKIIAEPILQQTMQIVNKALQDCKLTINQIQKVILVGGSTKSKLVKQLLANTFGQQKLVSHINPDEIVALGAAIEADILAGNRSDTLLLDVTPLSLGIETMGGLMDVIIPRNSKIPQGAAREYTTSKDGQVNIKISVYQGERELVEQNRKLAEFVLNNIPAMPAGLPKVQVKFILNADGILKVQATELRSNVSSNIEVKPQYGLTDSQVETMLTDSITYAKQDVETRLNTETKLEAEQIIYLTQQFIAKNKELLNNDEISQTQHLILNLQKTMPLDRHTISSAIETLNNYTTPFAHRVMDKAISKSLKGQKL